MTPARCRTNPPSPQPQPIRAAHPRVAPPPPLSITKPLTTLPCAASRSDWLPALPVRRPIRDLLSGAARSPIGQRACPSSPASQSRRLTLPTSALPMEMTLIRSGLRGSFRFGAVASMAAAATTAATTATLGRERGRGLLSALAPPLARHFRVLPPSPPRVSIATAAGGDLARFGGSCGSRLSDGEGGGAPSEPPQGSPQGPPQGFGARLEPFLELFSAPWGL